MFECILQSSDITFAMLADPAAALDVVLGDTGKFTTCLKRWVELVVGLDWSQEG